ncbi:MAG: hypothetical protein QM811_04795 [Pirellulales bacterium]
MLLWLHAHGQPARIWWSMGLPLFWGVLGYVWYRSFVRCAADEVRDQGDALAIRVGDDVERVPLHDVINVTEAANLLPYNIVMLRTGCRFGTSIMVLARLRWNVLTVADSRLETLIRRIDLARAEFFVADARNGPRPLGDRT